MPIMIVNFDTGSGGGGGASGVGAAFENGDLAAGVFVFAHTLGVQYPVITVYDDSNAIVDPDEITAVNTNTASVDLTSYGVISGTWQVRGVA